VLIREAELVDVAEVVTECRDPKDNEFLELVVKREGYVSDQRGQGLAGFTSVSWDSDPYLPGFFTTRTGKGNCLTPLRPPVSRGQTVASRERGGCPNNNR
jgi:hypothetical protein